MRGPALNVLEGAVALAEAEGVTSDDSDGRGRARASQRRRGRRPADGSSPTTAPATATTTPRQRLHQEHPRQRSRRSALLARRDGRRRRGPAVHRPPPDHQRVSEDVGNADPRALQVAVAAAQALDWVGLPEAQYALAQATVYLATAPKIDPRGQAYWHAVADVRGQGLAPGPEPPAQRARTAG